MGNSAFCARKKNTSTQVNKETNGLQLKYENIAFALTNFLMNDVIQIVWKYARPPQLLVHEYLPFHMQPSLPAQLMVWDIEHDRTGATRMTMHPKTWVASRTSTESDGLSTGRQTLTFTNIVSGKHDLFAIGYDAPYQTGYYHVSRLALNPTTPQEWQPPCLLAKWSLSSRARLLMTALGNLVFMLSNSLSGDQSPPTLTVWDTTARLPNLWVQIYQGQSQNQGDVSQIVAGNRVTGNNGKHHPFLLVKRSDGGCSEVFDLINDDVTGKWHNTSKCPLWSRWATAVSWRNEVIFIPRRGFTNSVMSYHVMDDSWICHSPMPVQLVNVSATVVEDRLLILFGTDEYESKEWDRARILCFDLEKRQWSTLGIYSRPGSSYHTVISAL